MFELSPEEQIKQLRKENANLQALNAELENGIKHFEEKLKFEMRQNVFAKITAKSHELIMNAAVANYLLDPPPALLKCSAVKAGHSSEFLVHLNNIIAIKSDGRIKHIHLESAISPTQGGVAQQMITYNNDEMSWEELLRLINKNAEILHRVNKSHAVNIYHYTLQNNTNFIINEDLKKKIDVAFHSFKVDSHFNLSDYTKKLLEIKQLMDKQMGFALNYQKLEEISRSIKSHLVPNSP